MCPFYILSTCPSKGLCTALPVSEDEEEDDVFSLRSLYYDRAGGDVMGCRRPKLKIFQHARIISTMEFSSVCF